MSRTAPRRAHKAFVGIVLSLLIILSGCASSAVAADVAPARPVLDWESSPKVLWQSRTKLLSDPIVVGDVVLAYEFLGSGHEELVARKAGNGAKLWSQRTVPGVDAVGTDHEVVNTKLGDVETVAFIAYTKQSPSQYAGVPTVVDVKSGKSVTSVPAGAFVSARPDTCGDTYCVFGKPAAAQGGMYTYTFTGGSKGTWKRGASGGFAPLEGFVVTEGLWMKERRDGFTVRYAPESGSVWERNYTDIFGPGTTPTHGWWWFADRDDDDLPILGWAQAPYRGPNTNRTLDMSAQKVVALDRKSGKTLWAIKGGGRCPVVSGSRIKDGRLALCRFTSGTQTVIEKGGEYTSSWANVRLQVIGVNQADGSIRWTLDLGGERANYAWDDHGGIDFSVGDEPMAMRNGHAITISAASGEAKNVPDGAALLCNLDYEHVRLRGAWSQGQLSDEYWSYGTYQLCSSTGKVGIATQLTYGSLDAAGYDISETNVVPMGPGMVAFAARGG